MTFNPPATGVTNSRLQRIRRVSRAMAWVTLAGALLVPVALVAIAAFEPTGLDDWLRSAVDASNSTVLTPATRIATLAIACIPVLLAVAVLLLLHKLFLGFSRGAVLVPASGRILRQIGLIIAILAPLQIVLCAVASVVLSLPNPPGERELAIGIGSDDISTLIAGMLLIVLGWTLEEAASVADENSRFV